MSFFGNRRQQPETATPPTIEKTSQPRPVTTQQPVGFETVLGANCTLEGVLRSNANVRLDGTFTGTLEITGNVLVGETAKITADINARNISIAGAVRGNVSGKKVQLLRTGRIWGDITATALTTEEGAFIDGKITMVSHDAVGVETSTRSDVTLLLDADERLPVPDSPTEPVALADDVEENNGTTFDDMHESGEEDTPPEDAPTPGNESRG